MKYFLLFCLALLLLPVFGGAQLSFTSHGEPAALLPIQDEYDEDDLTYEYSGFSVGINVGIYFGSKKTANFYNGQCAGDLLENPDDVRCFTIYERLGMDGGGNTSFLNDRNYILTYYGATDMSLNSDSYPINMRYNPAMFVGLHLRYNFNRDAALVFNSNSVRLRAVDQFSLRFYGTGSQQNAQNDTRLFQITGKEDRYHLNFGYRQGFENNVDMNTYIQLGGSMLATRVKSNEIYVADRIYALYVGTATQGQLTSYQPRTDVGFGYYTSLGFEFFLKEKFTLDLSLNYSRDKAKLISYEENVGNMYFQLAFTL